MELVRIQEAAVLTGMSTRTIRRRISAGELEAVIDQRDRRRKILRVDDLRAMLKEVPMKHAS